MLQNNKKKRKGKGGAQTAVRGRQQQAVRTQQQPVDNQAVLYTKPPSCAFAEHKCNTCYLTNTTAASRTQQCQNASHASQCRAPRHLHRGGKRRGNRYWVAHTHSLLPMRLTAVISFDFYSFQQERASPTKQEVPEEGEEEMYDICLL